MQQRRSRDAAEMQQRRSLPRARAGAAAASHGGRHPHPQEVQQRLREEVAAALQQHAGSLAAVIEEELPYLKEPPYLTLL